jgi:hypothetical protein
MSTNNTYRPNALANTKGVATVNGTLVTVQLLTADPTNVSGVPEAWFNLTDHKLKVWDGTTKYSSVALT